MKEPFMVIQEREKNILAILSIFAVLLVFWYVFKPSGEKYKLLKSDIQKLQAELREPSVTDESLKEMREKVESLTADISRLNQQLPLTEKRGFLIKDLEDLAKENSIEIASFVPKEAIPVTMAGKEISPKMKKYRKKSRTLEDMHAKVLKTVISIDSSGKFKDYTNFFADIITYYRAVEVSDLIITRAGTSAKVGQDKRFARSRSGKDPLADAKNMDLNVSFTLYAYTSLPHG